MRVPTLGHHLLGIAIITTVLSAVCGSAYGLWTSTGTGSGSGSAGATVAVTLSPAGTGGTLFPGGQASVVLTVANPNSASVRIGSLSLDTSQGTGGFTFDASHSGCATTSLSFVGQTNAGNGWTVPGKVGTFNGSLSITLPSALMLAANAANACQGAISTIYLIASP